MWYLPHVHACFQITLSFKDINRIELEDYATFMGFRGRSEDNLPAMQETQVQSLSWDSCPENSMDRRAWQATVHGVI